MSETNQPASQEPAESGPRLVNGLTPEQRAERHRNADTLCGKSVRCHLGAIAVFVIVWMSSPNHPHNITLGYQIFQCTCLAVGLALWIAAWVFMLKARINYRESTFAKALLGIYIGVAAFVLFYVIFLIALNLVIIALFPGCSPLIG
jgi:hypothetical protein